MANGALSEIRQELAAIRRELPGMIWDAMRQIEAEQKGKQISAAIGATLRNHQR
jgi:hypothetical protein